jgi:hypothetical protein
VIITGEQAILYPVLGGALVAWGVAFYQVRSGRKDQALKEAKTEQEKKELAAAVASDKDHKTATAIGDIGAKIDTHITAFNEHRADDVKAFDKLEQQGAETGKQLVGIDTRLGAVEKGFEKIDTKLDRLIESHIEAKTLARTTLSSGG